MLIKFKLQGKTRVIKQSGPNDFTAYELDNPTRALGYYSSLQNAVLRIIKDAGNLDEAGKEEVIQLKDYVKRFENLCDEIKGAEPHDLLKDAVFEKTAAKIAGEIRAEQYANKKKDESESKESPQEESFGDDF